MQLIIGEQEIMYVSTGSFYYHATELTEDYIQLFKEEN